MLYVLLSLVCWMAIFLLDSVICPFYNWALFSNISQMRSKCGENKTNGAWGMVKCVTEVLTTYWSLLWSIPIQTNSDMEFICFLWWQSKSLLMARPSMHLFSNKSWTMSKNQSKYLHNSAYYIISNNAQSMYLFREVCHTEFHRLPDVIKNIIFFLVCLLLLLVVFFFLFFLLLIFCH